MDTAWQQAPWVPCSGQRSASNWPLWGWSLCGMTADWSGYMTLTNQGPPLWLDHCLCVMCVYVCVWPRPFVQYLLICFGDSLIDTRDYFSFYSELWRAEALVFNVLYIFFYWEQLYIILLSFKTWIYFKHWILMVFHGGLKYFKLAQSATIPIFMCFCQGYCISGVLIHAHIS